MVAFVKGSSRTDTSLEYNERKLDQGKAVFIAAYNYWPEKDQLQREQKLERLNELAQRKSDRVRKHIAHMSLNFHPNDKLTDKQLAIIAAQYLKAIDFADQPALVYKHLDAGHPHLHIVSSNIRSNGIRISNDLRSKKHLRQVCQRLEKTHQLTPAEEQDPDRRRMRRPGMQHVGRLQYGQVPTRSGIEYILEKILEKYIYCSLDNLNAVLGRYNVMADRGRPSSHLYQNRGLYYRMLNDNGQKIGAPIKASALPQRPTLDYLEQRFLKNQLKLQQREYDLHIACQIDIHTFRPPSSPSLDKFIRTMESERIQVVMDRSLKDNPLQPDGHGFYYIDWVQKAVFRDTELGEKYSALSVFQRLRLDRTLEELVGKGHLQLSNLREAALLLEKDPSKKLGLWMELASRHDQWLKAQEKERPPQIRQRQRDRDMELEL
jgi:hypothetical protein